MFNLYNNTKHDVSFNRKILKQYNYICIYLKNSINLIESNFIVTLRWHRLSFESSKVMSKKKLTCIVGKSD